MRENALGLAREARAAVHALQHELATGRRGVVAVSGVLAEQLARELGAGADAGAVRVDGDVPSLSADVLVRVVAGDPSEADLDLVRAADARGVPVVLVQLWPQADWTRPFVLSPFVVECQAGKGFPLREIADRIVDASARSPSLASAIPAVRESVERKLILRSVARAAVLGAFARHVSTRPRITIEQVRMVARLTATGRGAGAGIRDDPAALAGVLSVVLASGFAFRSVARTARLVVPGPVANATVAAAGTWALARAAKAYAARGSS